MSKTIIIPTLSGTPLTVDNASIYVDDTSITVDMTYLDGDNRFFKITPREYSDKVTLEWYNELTQELVTTETCYTTRQNNYMIVPFTKNDFLEGDQFEITIRDFNTRKVLRKDKVYCVMTSDLENFQLINKSDDGVVYF